jgi:hypothetical protein
METYKAYIEIPVIVEYEVEPYEAPTPDCPGYPGDTIINEYQIEGHAITEYRRIDLKPVCQALNRLKFLGRIGNLETINQMIGVMESEINHLVNAKTLHDDIYNLLETEEDRIIDEISDDIIARREAAEEDRAEAVAEEREFRMVDEVERLGASIIHCGQ